MTTDKKKRIRRNHTAALKAQILAECAAPGASVARVAMAHGINANIVHGWRKLAREQGVSPVATATTATTTFVPLTIETPMPPTPPRIDVEVRRGPVVMSIAWPLSATAEMTSWMRELLR